MRRLITDINTALLARVQAAVPTAGQVEIHDGEVSVLVMRLRIQAWPAIFVGYQGLAEPRGKQGRRRMEPLRFAVTVCTKCAEYQPGMDPVAAAILGDLLLALDGGLLFPDSLPLECDQDFIRDEFRPTVNSLNIIVRQTYMAAN